MIGRTSLVEQKRIQWAKEREEMARIGSWGPLKTNNSIRTTIRTFPPTEGPTLGDKRTKETSLPPYRAAGHYGSTVSLKSLSTETSGSGIANLKGVEYTGGSLINLHEQNAQEISHMRRRSPSLPPIYNKEQQQFLCQNQQRDFAIEGLRSLHYKPQKQQQYPQQPSDDHESRKNLPHHYGSPADECGGETSGYASDSIDVPHPAATQRFVTDYKSEGGGMAERTWQNPYYTTPESSLPPSRRFSEGRIGELNRPRWGSVWCQDTARGDPPPPSWLARLGQSSQVLVINHDSASSPDSSTTGSTGSENKTFLRGQNIPVDAEILHEREARRQKALELQNAIKQQLEEKDRQRKAEKEKRLREERLEEERLQRERTKEKERFEEEQRKLKEKEDAKMKKAEAMREVLAAAERLAREEKKNRRRREQDEEQLKDFESTPVAEKRPEQNAVATQQHVPVPNSTCTKETDSQKETDSEKEKTTISEIPQETPRDANSVQVPISKDIAIILSGRLEDPELLGKANLQLVNLVVTPSPRRCESGSNGLSLGLNALVTNIDSPSFSRNSARVSPRIVENRLLTPSKYRTPAGRDFGTQTDLEDDIQELREKIQELSNKDSGKERKDTTNASRRDMEKSTNVGATEELSMKALPRSKSQPRTTLDTRPRWNANRPGTRYRTQSEKDPHYQRRLRLRRRRIESSDEGSRSPSPDRRKVANSKSKTRNSMRRKAKLDSYDADLSMDSLNSVMPLRVDKDGRICLEGGKGERKDKVQSSNNHINEADRIEKLQDGNMWCGQEILARLSSLRDGLLMKQIEWDPERCLVSPAASEIF